VSLSDIVTTSGRVTARSSSAVVEVVTITTDGQIAGAPSGIAPSVTDWAAVLVCV
jgi:hypothetical protein